MEVFKKQFKELTDAEVSELSPEDMAKHEFLVSQRMQEAEIKLKPVLNIVRNDKEEVKP